MVSPPTSNNFQHRCNIFTAVFRDMEITREKVWRFIYHQLDLLLFLAWFKHITERQNRELYRYVIPNKTAKICVSLFRKCPRFPQFRRLLKLSSLSALVFGHRLPTVQQINWNPQLEPTAVYHFTNVNIEMPSRLCIMWDAFNANKMQ